MARFRIQEKIVIPFALVALFATVSASLVGLSLVSRAFETRVDDQISAGCALVSQSFYAVNPTILQSVKRVAGGDIVTYSKDGTILASTLGPQANPQLIAELTNADAMARATEGPGSAPLIRDVEVNGVQQSIAYQRVMARPGTFVAVVANTGTLVASQRAAERTVLLAAAASFILLLVASQFVARRVTAPIAQLLAFTRDVIPGKSAKRARIEGDDEVARLAQAFNDMLDRLENAQAAQVRSEKLAVAGLLAARVAHDVRNPLSSIKMQTQLLRARLRRRDDEDNRALLDSVLHDIDQVETVVRGMLELAKPGELKVQRTPLSSVVYDVLKQVSAQLTYRRIEVETTLDDKLPELALDVQRFRQALLNIVLNAADAMPDGGTLSVSTARDGASIVLNVCDDGVGIDPAVAGRIFDPFVSTKRDGVGLGLVNTKAVIESHGGTVALMPRKERGTCARITLPVQ